MSSTIINSRSPYFIKYDNTNSAGNAAGDLYSVELDIYIYDGEKGIDRPALPQYTINKIALTDTLFITIEVSELIRDYLETEYYNQAVDAVWVEILGNTFDNTGDQKKAYNDIYLGLDGWGYFEEGINPRNTVDPTQPSFTPMVLQDNITVYFVKGRDVRIPLFSETEPSITTGVTSELWNLADNFWEVEDAFWNGSNTTQNIVDSDFSSDKIQYLNLTTNNAVTGDKIDIESTIGTLQKVTITLVEICEPRFDQYRSIFYNKYGALQTFWVNKKSVQSTKVKSEEFHTNLVNLDTVSYNTTRHNKRRFQVDANKSISTNTALLDDSQNEPLEQMLAAEQIWLEKSQNANDVYPVIIRTTNLTHKTGVNDKMIQYSIDFDFANNMINDVR